MSIHRPRWLQVTVPSSGTRYVRTTVKAAGYSTLQTHNTHCIAENTRGKPDLVWGHPSHTPPGILEEFSELAQNRYIVVRDPIKTWATNFVDWKDNGRPLTSWNKMARSHQIQLGTSWEYQNSFVKEWEPYIHRVDKDPIEKFASWAGIEVKEEGERYSKLTRMKEAVEAKDLDKIQWLVGGTTYWRWFVEEATPVFADLYEQQGYDLWWTHGTTNSH